MHVLEAPYSDHLESFVNYLTLERNFSPHTRTSYMNDLNRYLLFAQNLEKPVAGITLADIQS
ncbi:MAG: site-specific integrase, partial [Chlorobiales bacterium]|nr:site-specific integrase [Chlorobiales bacterium]